MTEVFEGGIVVLINQLAQYFELLSVELGGGLGAADFRGEATGFLRLFEQLLNEAGGYPKLFSKLSLRDVAFVVGFYNFLPEVEGVCFRQGSISQGLATVINSTSTEQ